jgi:hypothetical protein
MAGDPFARMHSRLLARLGQEAVFHGASISVGFHRGVAVTGEYGEVTGVRDVVEIPAEHEPVAGDPITIGAASYVLDALETDNGYMKRFILRNA